MSHIIKKIQELHKDEKKAPKDYAGLKRIVTLKSSKDAISRIQQDEKRHTRILNKILRKERKYDID